MPLTQPKAAQINFDVTNISDPLIRLNSDETGSADKDAGLVVERGDDTNVALIYDESANEFAFINTTETGTTSGDVTIASYATLAVGRLDLDDSATIYLGTSNDFSLYHNGNNSFISDQGTGGIYVLTNDFLVKNSASDETFFRASDDGDVELYYDNAQKLVTTTTGVTVTGTVAATTYTGSGSSLTGVVPLAGGTMTGTLQMADEIIQRPELKDYSETKIGVAAASTVDLDMTSGNVFTVTADQNTTFTFSNPSPTGKSCSFTLVWTQGSSDWTATWPASVDWAGGSAPDVTSGSGKIDIYTFFTMDAGTIWYGFQAGADMG